MQERHYLVIDKTKFFYSGITVSKLQSGVYRTIWDDEKKVGLEIKDMPKTEWIKINNHIIDFVLTDFQLFWNKESAYVKNKQVFKRGCLLYGSQGCGKSQLVFKAIELFLEREGIVIYMNNPRMLTDMINQVRMIEPHTNIMVIAEDIDEIIRQHGETGILQMLDGFCSTQNIYYIATTNFPDQLKDRLTNRPQRFDIVAEITIPDKEARESFIRAKAVQYDSDINITEYLKATEGMSFAHINELFVATQILEYDLQETLARIKNMKYPKKVGSAALGFSVNGK